MQRRTAIQLFIAIDIIILILIFTNGPHFWKQLKFMLGITPTEQTVPINNPNGGPELGEANLLRIPSLGISAPIQYVEEINEDVFQRALQDGVVHYPNTADVGQAGNSYFFGHSSDFALAAGNYKTVFALLPRIKNGAEIAISGKDGQVYRYEVIDQKVINNEDVHVLSQETNGEKILTLQTSYPVGTALQRYIVKAKLKE